MAKFKPGHKGLKPVGAKSKKTLILESFAKDIVEGGMDKFQQELNKLKGQAFVYAYLTLFEYVKPKLSRATIEGGDRPVELTIGYGKNEDNIQS